MNMHDYYYRLYKLFNNPISISLRVFFFLLFPILLSFNKGDFNFIKQALFVYFFLLIQEGYIFTKVNKSKPRLSVRDRVKDPEILLDVKARYVFNKYNTSYDVIRNTPHKIHEIIFIIKKIGGGFKLEKVDIPKADLIAQSREVVEYVGGNYITGLDLFVAYLLLSEEKTHFLQKKDLKKEDLINILYWARNKYHIEKKLKFKIKFKGLGVFDNLAYGWNYEVKKYALDFTSHVLSFKHPPTAVGRKQEYEDMLIALSKDEANSVVLVGEPGTGRTSLVNFFAYYSHLGSVPSHLKHRKLYMLMIDQLLAGTNNKGEIEERINLFLTEIEHSGNVILFIPNIENVLGGGGFDFDLSGVLYEYLKQQKIQIIGTTTPGMYKSILEKKDNLQDLLEVIHLDEPAESTALFMLFEKTDEIENKYDVNLTYEAIKMSVILSSSYFPDKYLPGKAINLLEGVASGVRLERNESSHKLSVLSRHKRRIVTHQDVIHFVEKKTKVVLSDPTNEEKDVLLHLEEKMHERIVAQAEAVSIVAQTIRRLRSGFSNKGRPISSFLFLGPTGVGKTETAKALASLYFGDESAMIRVDMSEYQTQDQIPRLLGSLPGEEVISNSFLDEVRARPFSLILLDEFEKANTQILDLFLQVFEDGRLTGNDGKTVSFENTIIITTSNAGSEFIRENMSSGVTPQSLKQQLIEHLLKSSIFKPELLNRFDEIVVYKPLEQSDMKSIAKLLISESLQQLEEKQIQITFDEKVIDKVAVEGYDQQFGARPIRRYIKSTLENYLSRLVLEGAIQKGSSYKLSVDDSNNFILQ